jgi:cellobiose phosphorylase
MTLTGQVFPIMSGLADDALIQKTYKSAQKYLKDPKLGGYHLNTNFGEIALNLGRAFSFSYGDKENGAFFSHMIVMFMYAMYSRGHVQEGYEVFSSIYKMCMDLETNKIVPMIPEYFDAEGRGAYLFLTGSASWMVLTILTQMFGVTSKLGDLVLAPKLVKAQFEENAVITAFYDGIKIRVTYQNPQKLDFGQYKISSVKINGQEVKEININNAEATIAKKAFKQLAKADAVNEIVVELKGAKN